ncbi:MAG: hypothetical protein ACLUNO_02930 [Oscillospiraceae bacterium]
MTYNFDEIIDRRHTNALNTDGFRGYIFHAGPEKVFAFRDEEFVRMWVADMEFGVAPEILDALRARIDRRIFGYTGLYDDEYYHTFSKWCKDHYDWSFPERAAVRLAGHHSRTVPADGNALHHGRKGAAQHPGLRLFSPRGGVRRCGCADFPAA